MYVTYFDEVKNDPKQGQDSYWVGGLCVPIDDVTAIEHRLNSIAMDWFGSSELTVDTEFHAKLIYGGKGNCKGMDHGDRLDLMEELVSVIAEFPNIKRVYARIVTSRLKSSTRKVNEIAFAFFCERAHMAVKDEKSLTILIGDRDDEQVKKMVADFARYREQGTFWTYSIKIPNIVDTVYFSQSHHSRLVQLADIYMHYITHMYSDSRKGAFAEALRKRYVGKNLYAHRFKEWPNS